MASPLAQYVDKSRRVLHLISRLSSLVDEEGYENIGTKEVPDFQLSAHYLGRFGDYCRGLANALNRFEELERPPPGAEELKVWLTEVREHVLAIARHVDEHGVRATMEGPCSALSDLIGQDYETGLDVLYDADLLSHDPFFQLEHSHDSSRSSEAKTETAEKHEASESIDVARMCAEVEERYSRRMTELGFPTGGTPCSHYISADHPNYQAVQIASKERDHSLRIIHEEYLPEPSTMPEGWYGDLWHKSIETTHDLIEYIRDRRSFVALLIRLRGSVDFRAQFDANGLPRDENLDNITVGNVHHAITHLRKIGQLAHGNRPKVPNDLHTPENMINPEKIIQALDELYDWLHEQAPSPPTGSPRISEDFIEAIESKLPEHQRALEKALRQLDEEGEIEPELRNIVGDVPEELRAELTQITSDMQAKSAEFKDNWEQEYGEPFPKSYSDWKRFVMMATGDHELAMGLDFSPENVLPIIEGYLLRVGNMQLNGEKSAAESKGVEHQRTRRQPGRPKADYETEQRELAIYESWQKARDANVLKMKFASQNNMDTAEVDRILDRVHKRKKRSDK